ncbi:hypothetical protein OEZ85_001849 [Tetradesmus obliquus]|uniref:(S)-ureidoglycine aminohydrolase cupin domain-containing protein n=1 Tax=Tetradesmus obliquus TaxID=3088 RepID=A0ABY8U1A1_TETOB|nr:hypothetical protein OEZ85_001849 [Tetradesmus obliquus]
MSTLSAHRVCPCAPRARPVPRASRLQVRAAVSTSKVVVKSNVSKEQLEEMGVPRWPTWGCGASTFPWSYAENETCYVLQGRVLVTPDGGEAVEIKAGDMATFPAGMSCTWDVKEAINKHYNFH